MGSVLPPEDHELFQERMLEWTAEEMPKGPIETYLLSVAALASVRMDRCARNECSAALRLREETMHLWQYNQDRRIDRAFKKFNENPKAARGRLTSFASGCGWLAGKWKGLLKAIDGEGVWTDAQLNHAVWFWPENNESPLKTEELRALATRLSGESPAGAGDRAQARKRLRRALAAEIERLEDVRADLWYNFDGPDLAHKINLAAIQFDEVGALRHRYGAAAASDFHRAFRLLGARQKLAAGLQKLAEKYGAQAGGRPVHDQIELERWFRNRGPVKRDEAPETATPPVAVVGTEAAETWTPELVAEALAAFEAAREAQLRNEMVESPSSEAAADTSVAEASPATACQEGSSPVPKQGPNVAPAASKEVPAVPPTASDP
jgi:hypothetical protein